MVSGTFFLRKKVPDTISPGYTGRPMTPAAHRKQSLLLAALETLVLRALTPDGYMAGSAESGLLFELCPEGMPAGFVQALAGEDHHSHHGGEDNASSASSSQCPIGHLLAPAIATDVDAVSVAVAATPLPGDSPATPLFRPTRTGYRPRAPPA